MSFLENAPCHSSLGAPCSYSLYAAGFLVLTSQGKQEFYCPDAKVAAGSLKKAVQDVVDCI